MVERKLRPGSVRHTDPEGKWVVTQPGGPLFSTAIMLATEYYSHGEWKKVFEDGQSEPDLTKTGNMKD